MIDNTDDANCKTEEKHNDATLNRPAGDRVVDAPSVLVDLPRYIRQIKQEDAWTKNDRNSITVFKTRDMAIVLGGLRAGAEMPAHKAEGIMSIQLIHGSLDLNTDELSETMKAGQIAAIHKGCNYRLIAQEESIYLLTICDVE